MKNKKNKQVPFVSSSEEAVQEFLNWYALNSSIDEDELFVQGQLKKLAAQIYEAGYQNGRADARSDAAVEAAEAEWFGG